MAFERKSILFYCVVIATAVASDFKLTILHTNDVHARIEEANANGSPCDHDNEQCFGGASRIKTMVDKKRAKYPNTIVLDAGDEYQGTLFFFVFGGKATARFMNSIGYDVMALGNHEFDNGIAGLYPLLDKLKCPVVAANADFGLEPTVADKVKNSTVLDVGGTRVGVVGYVTTDTPFLSNTEDVIFRPEYDAVQEEVDRLTADGVKVIIALGHSGYTKDLELAKTLTNVDVVVGGHSNTFLYTGDPPADEKPSGPYPTVVKNKKTGKPVLVVQDYAFGKYLGELHVTFDNKGEVKSWSGDPVLLSEKVPKDPDTQDILKEYLPKLKAMKTTPIGYSQVALPYDRMKCRTTECNLGNMVTDAMLHQNVRHSNTSYWSDVGIAVFNAGGLRASIGAGPVTMEQVVFVMPFRNTIDLVEVTGQTLYDMFEFAASRWSDDIDKVFAGFLQVKGVQIVYNMEKPKGERVVDLKVVCTKCPIPEFQPVKRDQVYKVLMTSFLSGGGDGFKIFPDALIKKKSLGVVDTDTVLAYINATSPIIAGVEGRIRHTKDLDLCRPAIADFWKPAVNLLPLFPNKGY